MKVCKICNTENQEKARICHHCGEYLKTPMWRDLLLIGFICLFTGLFNGNNIFVLFLLPAVLLLPIAIVLGVIDAIKVQIIREQNNIDLMALIKEKDDKKKKLDKKHSLRTNVYYITVIFAVIITIIMNSFFNFNSDYIITKEMYGDDYPFTIDNLKLKCENDAVWVVDDKGNIYALNGLASAKFEGLENFKGYTTPENILIKGKSDDNIQKKGFELCK